MYYSKLTTGFYDSTIHGARHLSIVDPAWTHPQIERVTTDPETGETLDRWMEDDRSIVAPTIEIDNPDCKIPADAVEITAEEHAALLEGQSQGKLIVAGLGGHPELADPPEVDPQIAIDAKLARLRTVRESVLDRLGGIAGRASRKGDTVTAGACDAAAESLLDITKDLPSDLDAIEFKVLTRYKSIVTTAALAAPSLISAFAGVDL